MTRRAFSLVELSIVLVILGLLVGGILAGQSLIHAGELRKTIGDMDKIKTSTTAFKDKYFAIPGDMANATSFWGAADGSTGLTTACYTSTATGTCNGNGDGNLGLGPENYRFWQQLTLAGFWPGGLTGVPSSPSRSSYTTDEIGVNVPRSPLKATLGYGLRYSWSTFAFSTTSMRKQNTLTISSCCYDDGSTRRSVEGGNVPSVDAWNMDVKMDDGAPGSGNNQIYSGYGGYIDAAFYNTAGNATCQPVIGLGL